MKICVSSKGKDDKASVDPRFGRAAYFAIFSVNDNKIISTEIVANTASGSMGGAGIKASESIVSKGVQVLITGNVGPNAFEVLSESNVEIITGVGGMSIKEAVERFLRGELGKTKAPTSPGRDQGEFRRGQGSRRNARQQRPGRGRGRGRQNW